MLTRVTVSNFQSLGAVTLDLGRITVIVGQSDAGKSAFLRAIEAAAFNDSVQGYTTRIKGQENVEKMTVGFTVTDGTEVVWERTKTTAKYFVTDPKGQVTEFNKMGRGNVPEDVQRILGMREITIDTNDARRIQFGSQHDSPFLIYDKGGVFASRVLGRLTGVNILSAAAKDCHADKLKSAEDEAGALNAVKALEKELIPYAEEEQRARHLQTVKQRLLELQVQSNRVRLMQRLRYDWCVNNAARQKLAQTMRPATWIPAAEAQLGVLWRSLGKLDLQVKTLVGIRRTRQELAALPSPRVLPSLPSMKSLQSMSVLKDKWRDTQDRQVSLKGSLQRYEQDLRGREEQLVSFEKEFPLCPFTPHFKEVSGVFRCHDLMRVIRG